MHRGHTLLLCGMLPEITPNFNHKKASNKPRPTAVLQNKYEYSLQMPSTHGKQGRMEKLSAIRGDYKNATINVIWDYKLDPGTEKGLTVDKLVICDYGLSSDNSIIPMLGFWFRYI